MRLVMLSVLALLAAATCASCATPLMRPLEYLDEGSAATVSAVATPLVFARARPELASHARDYARLAAVDVNRSGHHEVWLLLYLRSTIDARVLANPGLAGETLLVLADDREIRLVRDARTAAEIGVSRPVHAPSGLDSAPHVYPVDGRTLAFIASSSLLRLRVGDTDPRPFVLWSDGRASLARFAESIGPDP